MALINSPDEATEPVLLIDWVYALPGFELLPSSVMSPKFAYGVVQPKPRDWARVSTHLRMRISEALH